MAKQIKHSFVHYYVQSFKDQEAPRIVGHSTDEKTGEIYYKFLDRKSANKLLSDEKKGEPEYKYRVVKETTIYETTNWE